MSLIRNNQCPPSHWWWWGGGALDTLLIMLESLNFSLMLGITYEEHFKCHGWLMFSMSPVRNHQSPPNHSQWYRGFWHTSNHGIDSKFGTQTRNPMSRLIRGQGWPISSMSLIRNQVTDDDAMVLDTLLIMLESLNFVHKLEIIYEDHLKC